MKKLFSLCLLVISLVVLSSCEGGNTQTPQPTPTDPTPTDPNDPDPTDPDPTDPPATPVITLTFSASSPVDYILENVEGSSTVGAEGMADPEITLEVGKRYRIINQALFAHPFAFSGSETYATSNVLLGDSSVDTAGSFETNAEVNFVENTDGFTFTLTRALADQLKSYLCTFHSSMFGTVKVTAQ
jgi:plastocyanin